MLKKPFTRRFQDWIQYAKDYAFTEWRQIVYYFIVVVTFVVAIAFCTLRGIGNDLADSFFFKAYLIAILSGTATWLYLRVSHTAAVSASKKAAKAARKAVEDKNTALKEKREIEDEACRLLDQVDAYKERVAQLEHEVKELKNWKERSLKANRALSQKLSNTEKALGQLASTPRITVKQRSTTPSTDTNPTSPKKATPSEDLNDIDAVLGVMRKN